jgi:hypothetical protein
VFVHETVSWAAVLGTVFSYIILLIELGPSRNPEKRVAITRRALGADSTIDKRFVCVSVTSMAVSAFCVRLE